MKKSLQDWLLPLAAAVFVSSLAGCDSKREETAQTSKTDASKARPTVLTVTTTPAVERQEPVTIASTGTFAAAEASQLMPSIEGLVAQTPVSVGGFVAEGAPVIVLDRIGPRRRLEEAEAREREAEASVAQAQSRLGAEIGDRVPEVQGAKAELAVAEAEAHTAQSEALRSTHLFRTGDVSRASDERAKANLVTAEARVASAQERLKAARNSVRQSVDAIAGARASLAATRAQAATARKALADATVRAPFSGWVTERFVSVGEYVTSSSKLARLERLKPLKLQLQVPETRLAQLKRGQTVQAIVAAFGADRFCGTVSLLNSALNATARTLLVEATFANQDLRLKPGMFAEASVELGFTQVRVAVPEKALEEDNRTDTYRVWVAENNRAYVRIVQPDRKEGSIALLLPGSLRAGERVILTNRERLTDGAAVQVQQ